MLEQMTLKTYSKYIVYKRTQPFIISSQAESLNPKFCGLYNGLFYLLNTIKFCCKTCRLHYNQLRALDSYYYFRKL